MTAGCHGAFVSEKLRTKDGVFEERRRAEYQRKEMKKNGKREEEPKKCIVLLTVTYAERRTKSEIEVFTKNDKNEITHQEVS